MGMFSVPLVVGNPQDGQSEEIFATVDTGAYFSMMPASMLQRLGLEPGEIMEFRLANGQGVEYPTAIALFATAGRFGAARVIFGPDGNYLLGATALQDLRLNIDLEHERLVPMPRLPL